MKHNKKLLSCFVSGMLFFNVSTSFSGSVDASTGARYYRRHDCSNSNPSSYYSYSLSFNSPITSSELPRTIIGNNDMVRDYDTSVVRLSCGGTGFIIDEHTIATAAHCVYDNAFLNITIDIIDTDNSVIDTINPTYIHIPSGFISPPQNHFSSYYDSALISVEEDLTDYGMFQLAISRDSYLTNSGSVIVSGFPQIYPPAYSGADWGIRFKASGVLDPLSSDDFLLWYDTDVAGGDSGGPVYVTEGVTANNQNHTLYEYKSVIGISTSEGSDLNAGLRVTDDILKFYYENDYII